MASANINDFQSMPMGSASAASAAQNMPLGLPNIGYKSGSRVGPLLDAFLTRCTDETVSGVSDTWGETSGHTVNDLQTLACPPTSSQLVQPFDWSGISIRFMINDRADYQMQFVIPGPESNTPSTFPDQNGMIQVGMAGFVPRLDTQSGSGPAVQIVPYIGAPPGQEDGEPVAAGMIGQTQPAPPPANGPRGNALKWVLQRSRRTVLQEDQFEKCTICLDNMKKGQHVQILPCFHKLHVKCCAKYFKTRGVKPLCPVCRFDMGNVAR